MTLMPIVYVSSMTAAIAFYEGLGFSVKHRQTNEMWTELAAGDAILALHRADPLPKPDRLRVALGLLATEPLETVVERLQQRGISLARGIADETFGRSVVVQDPDGLRIQISEHQREVVRPI
jgi:catechol 2,3-dioxygenase-like lactoylglutathione lyase family enzyme